MPSCTICGYPYWPYGREKLSLCVDCLGLNMMAAIEAHVRPEVPYVDEELAQRLLMEQALDGEWESQRRA